MPAYIVPGVYLRPKRTDLPDVHVVRTDVAAFAGFAERGPLPLPSPHDPNRKWRADDLAVRLTSWDEFRAIFGGMMPTGYLAYAVRGFFENGGTTCYVVRIAAVDAQDPAERPAFARWAFDAPGEHAFSTTLTQRAVAGERVLAVSTVDAAAGAILVDIGAGGTPVPERHVLAEVSGSRLTLSDGLRASYPPGTVVTGRKAALLVDAVSAGAWGNRIELQVTAMIARRNPERQNEVFDTFALRVSVRPGPDREHPREEEFYREVSLDPQSPAYICNVVNARSRLVHVWSPDDPCTADPASAATPRRTEFTAIKRPRSGFGRMRLAGGRDGLRKVTADDFGLIDLGEDNVRGLRAVEAIDEVSILCMPDAAFEPTRYAPSPPVPTAPCAPPPHDDDSAPPEWAQASDETAEPGRLDLTDRYRLNLELLAQCARRHDRVAILDPEGNAQPSQTIAWAASLDSTFAAAYAPWIRVPDPLQPRGNFRSVPASGHVAGVYAHTDLTEGVHHPPANVALIGVADAVERIGTAEQARLNPAGVNALRAFPGRGVRVWGARSLAAKDPAWRYIHVRRLMCMIEESVEDSMQWTAFEPNDDALRRTVAHSVSLFLEALWQRGGLAGAQPEQGFYVKCDETNNPQALVDSGQLVCEVGVAPAAPMEFIVFEVRQKPEGTDVVEL